MIEASAYTESTECIRIESPTGKSYRRTVKKNGKTMTVSKAVWVTRHGDPGDLLILYSCSGGDGETNCMNINHLYAGTNAENSQDSVESGRSSLRGGRGEQSGKNTITESDVREIRTRWADGARPIELAREYGVTSANIYCITRRKSWAWLD